MIVINYKRIIDSVKNYFLEDKNRILWILIMLLFPILLHFVAYPYEKKLASENFKKSILVEHPLNSFNGKAFVTDTYPIFKDIVIIGDSYSHFVSLDLGFDFANYACPGLTVKELDYVFDSAKKSNKKFAVVFIGPNDFLAKTSPKEFHDTLESQVNSLIKDFHFKVILVSYLPSRRTIDEEAANISLFPIKAYDNEIVSLCDEKDIYYLDMNDYGGIEKYYRMNSDDKDNLHYNYDFNVIIINKIYEKVLDIVSNRIRYE